LPIAAALILAAFQIVTNRLSAVDDMVTTNLCSGLGALLLLCAVLVVLPLDVMPALRHASAEQWLLFHHAADAWAVLGMAMIALGFAATVRLNTREAAAHVASD
jgi:drug/metabolite transporter (DMT)-like permease